jgi:hypothetical protein
MDGVGVALEHRYPGLHEILPHDCVGIFFQIVACSFEMRFCK